MGRGYVIVEGQGEVEAVVNLLTRLWRDLRLPVTHWAQPIRRRGLHTGLPCFGTLERALRFLGAHLGRPGAVYPAAREDPS